MDYSFTKYKNNPVLGNEELGTCFDAYIWRDGGKYRMDFSWRRERCCAVSFSDDGITWTDPVITYYKNPQSGWEDIVNRNCVIKVGDKYKMWYTGQKDFMYSYIGYAESDDGINFHKVQDEPILAPSMPYEGFSVMNPCVLYEDGVYKMWYSSGETYEPNSICYAESTDGIHFTRNIVNPIFYKNREKVFEQDRIGGCQVMHIGEWYYMFYIGYEDIHSARVCVARSRNGKYQWERSDLNPLIAPDEGKWDGDATYKPTALYFPETNTWRVYYNGRLTNKEYIGFAEYVGELFK